MVTMHNFGSPDGTVRPPKSLLAGPAPPPRDPLLPAAAPVLHVDLGHLKHWVAVEPSEVQTDAIR